MSLTLLDAETRGAFRSRPVAPQDAGPPEAFCSCLPGLETLSSPTLYSSCPIEAFGRPGLSATG